MTFVYLPFFTSELKILHLPSLLLPVLFHFTFTYFIYRNSARRDREDLSCTTARWAYVDSVDWCRENYFNCWVAKEVLDKNKARNNRSYRCLLPR